MLVSSPGPCWSLTPKKKKEAAGVHQTQLDGWKETDGGWKATDGTLKVTRAVYLGGSSCKKKKETKRKLWTSLGTALSLPWGIGHMISGRRRQKCGSCGV